MCAQHGASCFCYTCNKKRGRGEVAWTPDLASRTVDTVVKDQRHRPQGTGLCRFFQREASAGMANGQPSAYAAHPASRADTASPSQHCKAVHGLVLLLSPALQAAPTSRSEPALQKRGAEMHQEWGSEAPAPGLLQAHLGFYTQGGTLSSGVSSKTLSFIKLI